MDKQIDTRTPTPPAWQVEAVAEAILDARYGKESRRENGMPIKKGSTIWEQSEAAIKASGVEHIAGLAKAANEVLENAGNWMKEDDFYGALNELRTALSALPPELKGESHV